MLDALSVLDSGLDPSGLDLWPPLYAVVLGGSVGLERTRQLPARRRTIAPLLDRKRLEVHRLELRNAHEVEHGRRDL